MRLRYLNLTTIRWEKVPVLPNSWGGELCWAKVPRTTRDLQVWDEAKAEWVAVPEVHETVDKAGGENPDFLALEKAAEEAMAKPGAKEALLESLKGIREALGKAMP